MEKFKSTLRELRIEAGLTQDELADAIGVGRRTIITIENEEGANPSVGTVKRLLRYFEITFEELYPPGLTQEEWVTKSSALCCTCTYTRTEL